MLMEIDWSVYFALVPHSVAGLIADVTTDQGETQCEIQTICCRRGRAKRGVGGVGAGRGVGEGKSYECEPCVDAVLTVSSASYPQVPVPSAAQS